MLTVGMLNNINRLQEVVDRRLGIGQMSDSERFARAGGNLPEPNRILAEKVLLRFDMENSNRLLSEEKRLASDGGSSSSDVGTPAVFERTVIREAIYNMTGLKFVNADNSMFGAVALIPFSYRDSTAATAQSSRVYEGQEIPRSGVIQTFEEAYPIPQKLSLQMSDELLSLTSNKQLNWDSVQENQANASRIIAEDTDYLIFNEMLLASDEYGAIPTTGETLTSQVNGANNIFVLNGFPVVRPRQIYDLQGNAIGAAQNPVTVDVLPGLSSAVI